MARKPVMAANVTASVVTMMTASVTSCPVFACPVSAAEVPEWIAAGVRTHRLWEALPDGTPEQLARLMWAAMFEAAREVGEAYSEWDVERVHDGYRYED